MHSVANYPRAIKAEPLLPRRALPRLLAALGVLAFIFSATCPDDDDIQQKFLQSSKSKQRVVANYKSYWPLPWSLTRPRCTSEKSITGGQGCCTSSPFSPTSSELGRGRMQRRIPPCRPQQKPIEEPCSTWRHLRMRRGHRECTPLL
jgi:hypothetical protein